LLRHAAPGLVEAAEAKLRGGTVDRAAIENAVQGLRGIEDGDRIDTIVLACTHFPLLADELAASFGHDVQFVDGAAGIARRIEHLTQDKDFAGETANRAITTGDLSQLEALAPSLAKLGIERLEKF
jgi:glutamate racemase